MFVSAAALLPGSLPAPLTRLIGRDRELAAAHARLVEAAAPLLTITGPGGVGKTRLALAVVEDVAERFGDGVIWVDLAPISDPADVPDEIASALGISPARGNPIEAQIAAFLRSRQVLLLLDNCEHLGEAVAELISRLLAACPALQIVATSRAPLRIRGEVDLAVAPFPLPHSGGAAPSIANNPAVQLFAERARAVDAASLAEEDWLDDVAEICRRLDGLPLAIELAAARVRVLPVATIRNRLQRRLPLLEGGARDAPARQRTMRDAIGWSYDLLTLSERAAFRRLAIFRGGCTLAAVESVIAAMDDPAIEPLGVVTALVDSSLLRLEPGRDDEPRYRMLETVREFGLEHLDATNEEAAARNAHADFFLDLVEQAAPAMLGGNPVGWLHQLASDHENVRAALDWLCARGATQECLRLAGACGWYWYRWGHVREGRDRLQQAIADAGPEPTAALGRALYWAAELATRAGDLDAAAGLAQDALAVWGAVGDPIGCALAMHAAARVGQAHGHWAEAVRLYEAELPVWRETGNSRAIGMVLVELAVVSFGQGDVARARALTQEAATHYRKADERTWLAATDLYLGLFAVAEGRFAEAARLYRSCLTGYAEAGDAFLQSPLAGLARVAIEAGRPTTAAQLLGAVDAELRRTGMRFDQFEQVGRDEAEKRARTELSEAAFAGAYAAGVDLGRATWFKAADDIVSALEAAREDRGGLAVADLTRREREVLALIERGLSDRDVAAALFITQGTVRTHLTSIFGKLDVGSRTAAVAAGRRVGLL